jgi:hypothetical protein
MSSAVQSHGMFCAMSRVFGSTGFPASTSSAGATATVALAAQATERLPQEQPVLGTTKEAWPRRSEARTVEKLRRGGACGWQAGSAGRRREWGRAMAMRRSGRREIREAQACCGLSATAKYLKSEPRGWRERSRPAWQPNISDSETTVRVTGYGPEAFRRDFGSSANQ